MDDRSSYARRAGRASAQGDGGAEFPREVLDRLTEDRDQLTHDFNDTFVRQMFAISLDLHIALSRIEQGTGDPHAAEKIRKAIAGLDQAIDDLRNAVVGGTFGPLRRRDR